MEQGPGFHYQRHNSENEISDFGRVVVSEMLGELCGQNTIVAGIPSEPRRSVPADCSGTIASIGNNRWRSNRLCHKNLQASDLTGRFPGLGALVGAGEEDPPGTAHYPVLPGSR